MANFISTAIGIWATIAALASVVYFWRQRSRAMTETERSATSIIQNLKKVYSMPDGAEKIDKLADAHLQALDFEINPKAASETSESVPGPLRDR